MEITKKEMVEQIKIALKDEFEARVQEKRNKIYITFDNKEKFVLKVYKK